MFTSRLRCQPSRTGFVELPTYFADAVIRNQASLHINKCLLQDLHSTVHLGRRDRQRRGYLQHVGPNAEILQHHAQLEGAVAQLCRLAR